MSEKDYWEHFHGTERDGAGRGTGLNLLKVNGTGKKEKAIYKESKVYQNGSVSC